MNNKQKLHQIKLKQWASLFQQQASSGLTVKVWCTENNISVYAYNYWKHKLKQEYVEASLSEQHDIVPLTTQISELTNPVTPGRSAFIIPIARFAQNTQHHLYFHRGCFNTGNLKNFRRIPFAYYKGGASCLKIQIPIPLQVFILSVVLQIYAMESIPFQLSLSKNPICPYSFPTPCFSFAAGQPAKSKDCYGKVMFFYSSISVLTVGIFPGHVLLTNCGK